MLRMMITIISNIRRNFSAGDGVGANPAVYISFSAPRSRAWCKSAVAFGGSAAGDQTTVAARVRGCRHLFYAIVTNARA
jgi:hypothetical protein